MGNQHDGFGNRIGTQAAQINKLLTRTRFQSVHEVFVALHHEFPTTTESRVRGHVDWLRRNHPKRLEEKREGPNVFFRLV